MSATLSTIHVVTIAFNPGPELDAMIESLCHAGDGTGDVAGVAVRLTIVDNGEDPQRVDRLACEYAERLGVRVIRTGENVGYGRAANVGLEDATEPWVCVTNPDTVFHPGSLAQLVSAGERWDKGGVFGPRLLENDGSTYPSARALPLLSNGIGHALFVHIWRSNPWTRAYHGRTDKEHAAGWLSGACLLIRTTVWNQLGGFDPNYFMFFEDVDLGRRAGEAGYLNIYVPSAVVTHEQGASWKKRPAKMIRAHHDSAKRYLAGTYSGARYAPLRALLGTALNFRAWWQTRDAR